MTAIRCEDRSGASSDAGVGCKGLGAEPESDVEGVGDVKEEEEAATAAGAASAGAGAGGTSWKLGGGRRALAGR